ncbi:hypothetical protein AXF42_Ash019420 [Apostasia shenzhenica]|uniref:Trichome birefringence-like N-terminal domain-containing protein n=1 Tax=Apostasia shenzhenica TaxID=1088818 RepID=A0A2I0B4W4_9ASPA|nr:hypothetical protein AXF42_Ash019420 [Apostasia shenzhenica]
MAAGDAGARRRHPPFILVCFSILLFIAALFLFSALRSSVALEGLTTGGWPPDAKKTKEDGEFCNFSSGSWVRNPRPVAPRYDSSCKEIFKGWNCISNGKSNALDLLQWRWKPSGCDLPLLDPVHFLHRFRNKNIGKSSHCFS